MRRAGLAQGAWIAGLSVLLVVLAGFLIERNITTSAFDRLEATQEAQEAQRLSVELDAEIRLLENYGTTNSIWDDSYTSVRTGSRDAFASAFPPAEMHQLYRLDGVLGVGPQGDLRVGGLTKGGDEFTAPPAELARPDMLTRLFPAGGKPGEARCGVVATGTSPFLFCGLAAYRSDSVGPPAGGLVYLTGLDKDGIAVLGAHVGLPVTIANQTRRSGQPQPDITSLVGTVKVSTVALSNDRMVVDTAVPTVNGGPVILETSGARPVHRMAAATALASLALMLVTGILLLGVMVVLVSRGIRRQVQPLRRTAQAVIDSGDWSLRVGQTRGGEIAGLGGAIDRMLDVLEAKTEEAAREHAAREELMRRAVDEQRAAEEQALATAQTILDDTSELVVGPLAGVAARVDAVRAAADHIDQQLGETTRVTGTVVAQADSADDVMSALSESLRQVDGIAHLINGLAAQTNLLALNATIEAARAGAAGAGFHVVATEVKTLATSTGAATNEITDVIAGLQSSAAAVAASIAAMAEGIAGLGHATSAIRQAADLQRSTTAELDDQVAQALSQAQQMARR